MTPREAKAMHLLKQIFDSYYDLKLSDRLELSGTVLESKVDEIKSVLALFKDDVREDIQRGVVESEINQRFLFTEETAL